MRFASAPDHLDDLAPPQATAMEQARARALATLAAFDYQLLAPPLVDYLQTLTGGDADLDLQTFKFADTLSGQTLGIRADQTPQIARYHSATGGEAAGECRRYCYCGPVACTRPSQPWMERESLQLGAELFGAPSPGGDFEVALVAVRALQAAGAKKPEIDLGHVGLFAPLLQKARASARPALMRAIGMRNVAAIADLAAGKALPTQAAKRLSALAVCAGDEKALQQAATAAPAAARGELQNLRAVARRLAAHGAKVRFCLSDLGSYGYHTGIVFTLYDGGRQVARGGRYKNGVGFGANLRALPTRARAAAPAVAVPLAANSPGWRAAVEKLMAQKRKIRFVHAPAKATRPPRLLLTGGKWKLQEK